MAEAFVWLLAVAGLCLLAGWQLHRRRSDAPRRRQRQPVATTQMPPNSVVDESRLLAVDELRGAEQGRAADQRAADEQEQAEQQRLLAEFEAAQRAQDGAAPPAPDEQATADAARNEEEQLAAIYAEAQRQAEEQRLRDEFEAAQRAQAERAEAERAQAARVEAERIEQQRIEAERAEAERIESERIEAERFEAERLERQRIEAERIEAQRIEQARLAAAAHAEALRQTEQQRLHAELEAAQRAELEAAQRAQAEQPALPPRVLVVDDSKVVRIKTGRLLAQHQVQVAYAVDGLDAVQQLRDAVPDLVITDVEMPGMDGFELTRHIRDDARTARLPVIMITAADDRHREHAEAVGVSVLLGKPYAEDALIAHIRQALAQDAALPPQPELQDALA